VTARYWVACTWELLRSDPVWERAGIMLVEIAPPHELPDHARWVLFEDPGAPPELDGRAIELVFRQDGDSVRITGRRRL
jgi:hypothetical protein